MSRGFRKAIGLPVLLMLLAGACNTASESEITARINPELAFRPNILWIVAEDLGNNIPAFGDSTVSTPNLDLLASEGILYDNFYTPAPVCSPARAAIITGMYPNSIGAGHMRTGPWYRGRPSQEMIDFQSQFYPEDITPYEAIPDPKVRMFTEYLREAGYFTTNNAKEDYQFVRTPTAWDQSHNEAHWRSRPKGAPFFSVFNIGVTHESQIWMKMEDSLWIPEDLPVPIPPYLPDTEKARRDVRRMYSNILQMDARVGDILNQLKEDGLMDSTIIFWYTDHGGPLPRQKRALHDSGIKVPMIIRFPGKAQATARDARMISFIDLAPTVLSLTGIAPPEHMDGTAFLGPYIRETEPNYIFAAADRFDAKYEKNRAVRDLEFKYIRYYEPYKPMFLPVAYRNQMPIMQELYRVRSEGTATPEQELWFRPTRPQEELFYLQDDPHELNNLAGDPKYINKLIELREANIDWVTAIDDTGLVPEKELLDRFWPDGVQPRTQLPAVDINSGKVSIRCDTEGASIGYQFTNKKDPSESWNIYSSPISKPDSGSILVIAHRIGYLPSDTVTVDF